MSSTTQTDYEDYLSPPFVEAMTEAFQTLKGSPNAKLEDIHRVVHDLRDDRDNESDSHMRDIYNVLIKRVSNKEVLAMGSEQVLLLCNRCL